MHRWEYCASLDLGNLFENNVLTHFNDPRMPRFVVGNRLNPVPFIFGFGAILPLGVTVMAVCFSWIVRLMLVAFGMPIIAAMRAAAQSDVGFLFVFELVSLLTEALLVVEEYWR